MCAGVAGAYVLHGRPASATSPASAGLSQSPVAVPVGIAVARARDVPVRVTGIGTVTPFNTVTVRSRVDGELQQVLFHEGQDIHKGDLLAVIDPRTFQAALDEAKARLQQDQAGLANARLILDRDSRLGKDAFASQETVDTQASTVAGLEAQVAQDEAQIASAQTELSYTRIVSPIDGRAGLRLVDEGNIVHASDAGGLVVINQIHPISVLSTVPQSDVPAIRRALAAGTVEARAISREDSSVLDTGTLELMDNRIDPQSGTLELKSVFANSQDRLWPGQSLRVDVTTQTLHDALTVPSGAVQRGPDGAFVYTVGGDDKVAVTPVRLGPIASGFAVVESGLAAGQRVVTDGQYRLAPGVRAAAATPAG
nr:efflux RND transporter periplasmic adaptor subunit [Ancylobacter koreensis]